MYPTYLVIGTNVTSFLKINGIPKETHRLEKIFDISLKMYVNSGNLQKVTLQRFQKEAQNISTKTSLPKYKTFPPKFRSKSEKDPNISGR